MHKILVVCFLFLVKILASQSPQKISYQGVARSASGAVLSNSTIAVKFDIHRGSALGTIIFTEQHQGTTGLTTNAFGLFTTAIGSINSLSGIDWSNGPFFIEVSIDPANETSYKSVGTQELMSVPYALYAEKAGNAPPTPTITINSPNTVSNPSAGSYSINIPSSTVYSAGSGIAINAGVISSTVSIPTATITGSGQATVTSPSANAYVVTVPTQSLSISGNSLSISPGNTVLLPGSSITAGNSNITLNQSGNAYTITPVTPTLNVSGGAITGTYPTQTLTIPATSTTTLAAGNSNITLNQSGNAYTITPVTPTLNVNGGTLTGSYPTQTLTIPSSSTALVQGTNVTLNQSGNTYTISASTASLTAGNSNIALNQSGNAYTITPVTPTLNVNGGTLTGTYPTQTLTIPATSTTTLAAGNSNITLNQSGNAYTITPVTPTLDVNGGTLTGSYPTQTLTIPSSSTALVQGTNVTLNQSGNTYTISASTASLAAGNSNITLNQSGNAYTITPVTPTLNVNGGTLTGSYPTQTLTIPAASTTTLAAGNSNITLNQSGNAYTITPVTPTLNVNGGTLTGSYPTQTLTIPSSSTALVQGTNVTLSQSGNTYTISASTASLAAGNSNITLNQSGNTYTITPVTPTLNVNGGTLTGTYPTQTLTIPSSSTALVQGTNVTLNQSGNTYTISASTASLAAGNSNITLNQSGNAYTITPVTPTLNVNGGTLTGSYPTQTLTIPSSSTALVQGTNVTLNQSGNTYTISASTASLAAGNSNLILNQSGNAYTITPVTPTLNVNGGTLTGSYPTQTLTIPSSSTSLAAGNSNITLNQSGNAYTITPVTPTLNVNGGTLTGSYPTQTLTIPSSSTALVQGTNVTLNQSGNTYTISASTASLAAGNSNITLNQSGNAYTITPITPTLNVNGGTLTGTYPTQTLTIPAASTTTLAAGNSNITLNQSGNAYTITPVTPTLNVNGATLTGAYPTQTLTIPSSSTTLVQGNNINLSQSGNTYTIAAISPTLTAGTNVTITPVGAANAYTISAATTSYTGTAGNINVNANTVNLAATGVTAGAYGSSAGNAVPFFTVDNFGRLSAAGQYTPTILGDVTGSPNASTVSKLRGVAISAVVPTTGQVLQFDGTAWAPAVNSVGWSLTGSSGTTASNFIGTTDNLVFRVKTNSLDRAIFSTDNNLTLFSGDNANPGRISMNGNISNSIKVVEAVTTNNGSALSISSGDARTSTGNSFGGNLNLSAGAATGNGTSVIDFLTAGGGPTGSTRATPGIKMRLTGTGQLLLGTTGGAGANSKLVVADGHIESTQSSAPVIAGAGSLLGLAGSSANLSANSTDVCGTISIYTGLLGGGGKGNYAVITFDKSYVNPPVVILTPRSEEAAGLRAYVAATSTNGFTLAFSTGTAGLSTYEFNYMILAN
jgi:hypothetical protein